MRTNIEIDDQLMARVMAGGEFKTKREAVEEGLRLIARRKAYAAIRAARGTFVWDDSDEHWAKVRAEQEAEQAALAANAKASNTTVQQPAPTYRVNKKASGGK